MTPAESRESPERRRLMCCVLDVLRYDLETLAGILELLNVRGSVGWRDEFGRDLLPEDVAPILDELLRAGLVRPYAGSSGGTRLVEVPVEEAIGAANAPSTWWRITPAGWRLWRQWVRSSDGERP